MSLIVILEIIFFGIRKRQNQEEEEGIKFPVLLEKNHFHSQDAHSSVSSKKRDQLRIICLLCVT